MKKQTSKKKKKVDWLTVVLVGVLVIGLGIFFYPTFSDFYNRLHQSRAITSYTKTVNDNSKAQNEKLWKQAKDYNKEIAKRGFSMTLTKSQKKAYEKVLNVTDTGIMGYISIPSVNIRLPIYHDTTDSVLQIAVGHLAGSSLPVGGKSTHSVLTGHTGLPSAKLFTDIDQLKKGDTFMISSLNHEMYYKVYDIKTVLPDQVSSLKIEEGRDLCTLITCTPYGINTHRLLVTGYRIPKPKNFKDEATDYSRYLIPMVVILAVLVALIAFMKRRKKRFK